ncbi:hypothetical protein [Mesomycoplasma ovipneumoniae]|nr:hypothetical protein [Mesomycoplasma ovipneumoniae]WNM13949.1 hypothetical protein RNL96_02405 [Mesomycoplasma ovipneumoniae]
MNSPRLKKQKKVVIFGISGGVDSVLVSFLGKKPSLIHTLGLIMPIRDMSSDKTDIDQLVKKFEISTKEINLSSTLQNLKDLFSLKNQLAKIIKKYNYYLNSMQIENSFLFAASLKNIWSFERTITKSPKFIDF